MYNIFETENREEMISMRDILSNIIHHTGDLGFLNTVKVTGSDDSVSIESMDESRTVILKGRLNAPNESFKGEFGMQNLQILKGLINFSNFLTDDSTIEFVTGERKDEDGNTVVVPEEIEFTDSESQKSRYRLTSTRYIPNQAKFRGAEWNVVLNPTKSKISEFTQLASIFGAFETHFEVKTEDRKLIFSIGGDSVSGGFLIFDNDVDGNLSGESLMWQTSQVLSILKLADDPSNITMHFSDKGALQISVKSDLATYDYIMPSWRR